MNGLTRKDHACVAGDSGDHLACFAQDHDYIGPDPLKWVDRLADVNSASHFTDVEKRIIEARLNEMRRALERLTTGADSTCVARPAT